MSKTEYAAVTSSNDIKDVEIGALKSKTVQDLQVAVLGQGLMGTALTARLRLCDGVTVYAGSRNKEEGVVNFASAITNSSIIILAVPAQAHSYVVSEHHELLRNKIVIDLSNATGSDCNPYAHLLTLLPYSSVIKAFNTISAYDLASNGYAKSASMPICGDNASDKAIVLDLMGKMGLNGKDFGGADRGSCIEAIPLRLFSVETKITSLITLITLLFTYVYAYELYVNHKARPHFDGWLFILNKSICWSGLWLLSLSFLPGTLVQLAQAVQGRSFVRLNPFMTAFMGVRKGLGLAAALLITMHAIMAIMVFNSRYLGKFFSSSGDMNYRGELAMTLGIVAAALMVPMTLASMPAIGAALSWREYHFIFHHIGWFVLFTSWAHLLATSYPKMVTPSEWSDGIPSVGFMSSLLPTLVLGLKTLTILSYPRLKYIKSGQR